MNFNHSGILLAGETNIGLNRRRNEDGFVLCQPCGGTRAFALIADGIGGHSDGDLASAICCRDVLAAFRNTPQEEWEEDFLRTTLEAVNRKLFDRNYREGRLRPMGCTVVAAIFSEEKVIFANAGDSRLYEFCEKDSPSVLRQLSTDHVPDPRQMHRLFAKKRHGDMPCRKACGVILRALGIRKTAGVEIHTIHRLPDASFLLCTDGFYRGLSNAKIQAVFEKHLSVRKTANLLMRQSLLGKSMDNLTLIAGIPAAEEEDHVTA